MDKSISAAGWDGLLTQKKLRKNLALRKGVQKRKSKSVMNSKGRCIFIMYYEEIITASVSIFSVPLVEAGVGGV